MEDRNRRLARTEPNFKNNGIFNTQKGKQTCTQTATFESCGARTNKGVTDLNIELERQKLDQTDARNRRTSLRRIAFS